MEKSVGSLTHQLMIEQRREVNTPEACVELAKKYAVLDITGDDYVAIFRNGTYVVICAGDVDSYSSIEEGAKQALLEYSLLMKTHYDLSYDNGEFSSEEMASSEDIEIIQSERGDIPFFTGNKGNVFGIFWSSPDGETVTVDKAVLKEYLQRDIQEMEIVCVYDKSGQHKILM